MHEKDLHDKFIGYLHSIYPKKRELISILTDILKIERESISRRLNGKVLFTVREIGKIAEKLDISLDHLLNKKSDSTLLSLDLIRPLSLNSIDSLIKRIKLHKNTLEEIGGKPLHIGYIFDSLPVEFFSVYSNLCKFMYFKWVRHFTTENLHIDYTGWKLPEVINEYHRDIRNIWKKSESIFYIWDNPVIWNLTKEIDLFYRMRILNENDVFLIKQDLHNLLENIEMRTANNIENCESSENQFELYISSVNIGVSCIYYYAPGFSLIYYNTPFAHSDLYEDIEAFNNVYKWINSMKKVSTLISGSGAMERRIFFDEQHKIIDNCI